MLNDYDKIRRFDFIAPDASTYALGTGAMISTTQVKVFIPFPQKMASAPTGISISDVAHFKLIDGSSSPVCSAITFISATVFGIFVLCTATGLNVDSGTVLMANNASAAFTATGGEPNY